MLTEPEVVGVREAIGPHPFLAESLAVAGVLHQREEATIAVFALV